MVSLGSKSFFAGIVFTQVGDPLAHGRKGGFHCASSHRDTGLAVLPEAVGEGEDVAEARFAARDVTEGRFVAKVLTEGGPSAEDLVSTLTMLAGVGAGGSLERSAQVREEAVSGERCSSRQGFSCG